MEDNTDLQLKQHEFAGISAFKREKETFKANPHPEAQWFGEKKLGLFIHWGISSMHGNLEISWGFIADTPWDKDRNNSNKVPPSEYFKLADRFNPTDYDPEKWLKPAADAGFDYAVLTTRHHDGYAMWPSKYGGFGTRTHMGGRDLVAPYVEACRKLGLRVGLYYSPPDWHYNRDWMSYRWEGAGTPDNPYYDIDHRPAGPELTKRIKDMSNAFNSQPSSAEAAEFLNGYKEYICNQVEELLTSYGRIDVLWFDGGPEAITFQRMRQLQPWIVVNTRMHGYGDFSTPEGKMPEKPLDGWWELCESMSMDWGYTLPETYRPIEWITSRFSQAKSMGGNYLINAAPRPDGKMPDVYYQRMAAFGEWLKNNR